MWQEIEKIKVLEGCCEKEKAEISHNLGSMKIYLITDEK